MRRLLERWKKPARDSRASQDVADGFGLFLFDQVAEALLAEKTLGASKYEVRLVAPPQHLRAGCDLAVSLPCVEQPGAARALADAGVVVRGWIDDLSGTRDIVDLVTTVDFGDEIMVRAGNMKICVRKLDGVIVNTSGGGCPDIPYLNVMLVGKTLAEAPRPKEIGYTLCGLMLDRAFTEAERLLRGGAS